MGIHRYGNLGLMVEILFVTIFGLFVLTILIVGAIKIFEIIRRADEESDDK
jgi:hypothetical protein